MEPIKKIILVLEDEDLLLQAISKKLKLSGYGVVSCTQGKQALDYLASIEKKPDAIWLDYYLGDMNGLEFMKFVKDNPLWKDIPVMIVSNSAGEEKVHLILLDLIMPKKDGFETLKDLKNNPKLKHIPVIVSSNLGQQEDKDKVFALGAKDYFVKSDISLVELLEKIKKNV